MVVIVICVWGSEAVVGSLGNAVLLRRWEASWERARVGREGRVRVRAAALPCLLPACLSVAA